VIAANLGSSFSSPEQQASAYPHTPTTPACSLHAPHSPYTLNPAPAPSLHVPFPGRSLHSMPTRGNALHLSASS
jgi:hypothetical protein